MQPIKIIHTDPFFLEKQVLPRPALTKEDYEHRVSLLVEAMKAEGLSHVVIYGDREHFANIEYFSSYDCRFEEGLLIVGADGRKTVVVGNEGMGYSYQIPYEVDRVLYQNFSLQGQPRDESGTLTEVFHDAGITAGAQVGVVGYKYFYPAYTANPKKLYDIPMYIMQELYEAVPEAQVVNFTEAVTGLPNGIRMKIHSLREIAWAEYTATKTAAVILNLIANMQEGITELELSRKGNIDFSPVSMFSLVNFGPQHLSLGLRSPDDTPLKVGEVCGLCYSLRGSLTSRTGVAARDEASYSDELRPTIETFYKPFWSAIAAWYETMRADVTGGEVYKAVMDIIGGPEFGVTLNPGHNIGMDEWTNSPVYEGSELAIGSGTYMQCDIIGNSSSPVQNAICEDTVVVADEKMRAALLAEYPEMYERIRKRQEKMRTVLGINIDDSLLPMSNLNGVYFPFLMNENAIFSKK